jgi:hypothetical protein
MVDFDSLSPRSQSAILGALMSNLIAARCSSLRELATLSGATPYEIWFRLCAESQSAPCTIPANILGTTH